MSTQDFSSYYNKHCKIRLKSGKEVYGVIWANEEQEEEHYFASSKEYDSYKNALLDDSFSIKKQFNVVDINEVVSVESLENLLGDEDQY